jgi:hypothetical protein
VEVEVTSTASLPLAHPPPLLPTRPPQALLCAHCLCINSNATAAQFEQAVFIAEPLDLATQEKMDFGLIFATCTNTLYWSLRK